ncbi:MAG: hypothetical protein WB699_08080, partial [Bacteroidota bacterium]
VITPRQSSQSLSPSTARQKFPELEFSIRGLFTPAGYRCRCCLLFAPSPVLDHTSFDLAKALPARAKTRTGSIVCPSTRSQ